MSWIVPRMWENEDVWIIGGGPSVPKQFGVPDGIIQGVVNRTTPPSVYSPYMSALHNKHVIGINVAYLIGDWMDIIFFGDVNFWLSHLEGIANYPGLRVTCNSVAQAQRVDWIKYMEQDGEHPRGISLRPGKVSWNLNSGSAAISIAAQAGAKRIILLGFDMCLNGKQNQHWHDVYQRGQITTDKDTRTWESVFERHLRSFKFIAEDARKMGIEIINASPESRIKQFSKILVKDLL